MDRHEYCEVTETGTTSIPDVYTNTAECQAREHQPHIPGEVVATRRVDDVPDGLVMKEAEHELGGKKHVDGNRSCGNQSHVHMSGNSAIFML